MTEANALTSGGGKGGAQLVYLLFLVGMVTGGIATLIGLVIAYVNKKDAPDWLKTHYLFAIHTFWVGVLGVLAALAVFAGVTRLTREEAGLIAGGLAGAAVWLIVLVWWIMRCLRGLAHLRQDDTIAKPHGWPFLA